MKKRSVAIVGVVIATIGLLLAGGSAALPARAATIKYAVTTSRVKVGKGVLPKGTRVEVDYITVKKGHRYAGVDGRQLSYALRKRTGNQGGLQILTSHLKTVPKNAGDALWVLRKGKQYNSGTLNSSSLVLTRDNYVEYYRTGNLNTKPISSTKLTATRTRGKVTYLYAKTKMAKLPDRHIHKTGQYRYRLSIRNNHRKTGAASMSYSVGSLKNYFMKIVPATATEANNDFGGTLTIDFVIDYSGAAGLRAMIGASDKIVVGIVGVGTEHNGSTSHYTKHELKVTQTLKGFAESSLTFIQAGTRRVSVTGSRLLKPGERVILALQRDGYGEWTVMNGGQGIFVNTSANDPTYARVSDGEMVTVATLQAVLSN